MSVSELLVDEICLPLLTILLSRLTYLSVIYILCYRPKHYHREVHVSFSALISIYLFIILQFLLRLQSTSVIFKRESDLRLSLKNSIR